MNDEDEIISARRLRSPRISAESCDLSDACNPVPPKARALHHAMSNDAGRFDLRLVEEVSEATCSHRARKGIRRGIVWRAAYSVLLMHPEGSAASPQSSNHSEHLMLSSFPMTRHTH